MATKIKKSSKSSKRAPAKKSFFKNRLAIMFTLLVVLGLGAWGLMRSMAVPPDINLIGTESEQSGLYRPEIIDVDGCYYQQVKCIKEPCESIRVCLTPPPAPTLDPARLPNVPSTPEQTVPTDCVSWFDGCNNCKVSNGTIMGCTKMGCEVYQKPYCQNYSTTTTRPMPTPTTEMPLGCTSWFDGCNTCGVKDGLIAGCTRMGCEVYQKPYCMTYGEETSTPAPTSIPQQILITITNFNASAPCGTTHFKNYQFTCSLGAKHTVNDNTCISVEEAMKSAKSLCQTNPK